MASSWCSQAVWRFIPAEHSLLQWTRTRTSNPDLHEVLVGGEDALYHQERRYSPEEVEQLTINYEEALRSSCTAKEELKGAHCALNLYSYSNVVAGSNAHPPQLFHTNQYGLKSCCDLVGYARSNQRGPGSLACVFAAQACLTIIACHEACT